MHLPKRIRQLLVVLCCCLWSFSGDAVEDNDTPPAILLLDGYEQGHDWSDGVIAGIRQRLAGYHKPIDLQIAYLNGGRNNPEQAFPLIAQLLAAQHTTPFSAVFVNDDHALAFVRSQRARLFADMPVIATGFSTEMANQLAEDRLSTGIGRASDVQRNLHLLQQLHPKVRKVLIVADQSEAGRREQQRFVQAAPLNPGLTVQTIERWNLAELKNRLLTLTPDSLVFLLPTYQDVDGYRLPLAGLVDLLRNNSPVPVYSLWQEAIERGVIGGYVADAGQQGAQAADYLTRLLSGEPIGQLSPKPVSPTRALFNGQALAFFGVDADLLPRGSRLIHPVAGLDWRPVMLAAIVLLVGLVFGCGWLLYRRHRTIQALTQTHRQLHNNNELLTTLLDANSDQLYVKSRQGRYLACNQAFADFVAHPKGEVLNVHSKHLFQAPLLQLIQEQDEKVMTCDERVIEQGWIRMQGKEQLIECTKSPYKNARGDIIGILGANRDITARFYETSLLKHNGRALDAILRGTPLNQVLDEVVLGIEEMFPECLCSILLLDKDGRHLRVGSAPSLPEFYNREIEGLQVEEGNGCCGRAVFTGKAVIAENIQEHPCWSELKTLAAQAGLASCWSQPIFGAGVVLGTFAVYQHQPAAPKPHHWAMMEQSARLVSLALERRQAEEELQKLSRAVEQSPTMVLITDAKGVIEYVNEEFTDVTGYSLSEVQGLTPAVLNAGEAEAGFYQDMWKTIMSGQDWHGEVRNKTKSGQTYWSMLSISPILDDQGVITHFIGVSEDISSQKKTQEQIEQLAFYDPLTGLGNRRLFREQLEQELKKVQREHSVFALFYLDLDNFKQVNDTLGHDMGDRLLQTVAERIQQTLRQSDLIARLGGDEFIALLPDINHPAEVGLVAQKLLKNICQPLLLGSHEVEVTVSLGITLAPDDGEGWPVLMKNADLAMYRAKRRGRNNYQFFTREMNEEVVARVNMQQQIRSALENNEFYLHYQPQWSILSELQPVCLEALLRWRRPNGEQISPAEFIPIAEELGLIVPLGEWVLNEACRQGRQLMLSGNQTRIAVNLSMRQFFDPGLADKITTALQRHDFPAELLELEITESMIMEDVKTVVATLNGLKRLGVSLAIDDFGTGYSSLSYLKQLPFDHLKVDASFVRDIPDDKNDMEITAAVIAMAHKLGLKVVAEGIETHDQLAFLRENRCEMGQGYLLACPSPLEDIINLIDVEFE